MARNLVFDSRANASWHGVPCQVTLLSGRCTADWIPFFRVERNRASGAADSADFLQRSPIDREIAGGGAWAAVAGILPKRSISTQPAQEHFRLMRSLTASCG